MRPAARVRLVEAGRDFQPIFSVHILSPIYGCRLMMNRAKLSNYPTIERSKRLPRSLLMAIQLC